ncbi:HWE histidine kinase domain-containing protein [Litorisediminicola beolgyonensis]|uniref:histidine kinase n=1 Tax=Litorisediminicola beolgyonensis TaxID=1173614 RepID=A0ABW3ZLU0_9RHOB
MDRNPSRTAPDTGPVTLTNCDREPIHILGRTQRYGALLAVSSDWLVQHASENAADIIGPSFATPLGKPLSDLLPPAALRQIRNRLRMLESGSNATRIFDLVVQDRRFDVSIHQSGRHLILEFEPKRGERDGDALAQTYPLIQRIRDAASPDDMLREAARAVRALSGFDSVMVYRFQEDHSGVVVAESRRQTGQKYLGLHFPASDIPVQARALYTRSLLRLIADVSDEGVPIIPARSPEGTPLDLSLAVTRAVSPIHLEYLRNMGVAASMSVSIMKDGKLWGLFACHHQSPHYLEFEQRTAIELFAHLFSYELTRRQEGERNESQSRTQNLQRKLMNHLAEGDTLEASLLSVSDDLRAVIPHDGVVLVTQGRFHRSGDTPSEADLMTLEGLLNTTAASRVYSTDKLSQLMPHAEEFAKTCAGVLAIPISRTPRDYLLLCRREIPRNVAWAGEPAKGVQEGPNGDRLTPRKSFEAWRETVEGRCAPWSESDRHAADLLRSLLLEVFLRVSDAANAERARAHEHQELLIAELNHRVRNILNLMRSLLSQTRTQDMSTADFAKSLDGRIQSLARAHDQLTRKEWGPASLHEMLEHEFAAYLDDPDRARISGEDVMVSPDAYTTLALVLHEMVTNSVKYGGLSAKGGRAEVDLSLNAAGDLVIDWRERGGPAVQKPERRGFGTAIIERSIPYELGGEAKVSYIVTGVEARFLVPAEHISSTANVLPLRAIQGGAETAQAGLSGRAMVLEDTMIIAMDAADMLSDLGASEVDICAGIEEALERVATQDYEFALLDVNLGGKQSVPVAEALAAKGVPFALATGYGDVESVTKLYPPCKILQKPFSSASIMGALSSLGLMSRK